MPGCTTPERVIVNVQTTELGGLASLMITAGIDETMKAVTTEE